MTVGLRTIDVPSSVTENATVFIDFIAGVESGVVLVFQKPHDFQCVIQFLTRDGQPLVQKLGPDFYSIMGHGVRFAND